MSLLPCPTSSVGSIKTKKGIKSPARQKAEDLCQRAPLNGKGISVKGLWMAGSRCHSERLGGIGLTGP